MMIDYLCIESCRGCGVLIKPTRDGPFCVCTDCYKEHAQPKPHVELCAAGVLAVPVASGTTYSGILKKMIYRLKYDKDRTVVDDLVPLASAAFEALRAQESSLQVHDLTTGGPLLVPIPLHWMRMLTRGYNQAEMVAEQLAKRYKLKLDTRLLSRRRSTKAQHGLGKEQRLNNMIDAFRVNRWTTPPAPPIILVDDIYTSGATIAAAASALATHGFTRIYAITSARATLDSDRRNS